MTVKTRKNQKYSKTRSDLLRTKRKGQRCTATKADGTPCRGWAILGATVCRYHGGASPQVIAKANERLEKMEAEYLIEQELKRRAKKEGKLGGQLPIHPLEAMLDQVHEAAANVSVLRDYIADLGIEVDMDNAITLPEETYEKFHVPARVHIMVDLYNQERDRLVKYSKMCLDAGVDERRVRVAELQAQKMAQAFNETLNSVPDLTPDQRETLRRTLADRLRHLSSTPSPLGSPKAKEL